MRYFDVYVLALLKLIERKNGSDKLLKLSIFHPVLQEEKIALIDPQEEPTFRSKQNYVDMIGNCHRSKLPCDDFETTYSFVRLSLRM